MTSLYNKTQTGMIQSENLCDLCPFCKREEGEDFDFNEINYRLHDTFGLHSTFGVTWAPTKGNDAFESHEKLLRLFKLIKHQEEIIKALQSHTL